MFGIGVNVWEAVSRLFGPKNMGGQIFFNGLLARLTTSAKWQNSFQVSMVSCLKRQFV